MSGWIVSTCFLFSGCLFAGLGVGQFVFACLVVSVCKQVCPRVCFFTCASVSFLVLQYAFLVICISLLSLSANRQHQKRRHKLNLTHPRSPPVTTSHHQSGEVVQATHNKQPENNPSRMVKSGVRVFPGASELFSSTQR